MNGYSTRAKNEIVGLGCGDCCKRAFLSALVHTGGSLVFARGGMKIVISAGAKGIKNKVEKYALEMLDGVTVSGTDGETVIGGSGLTAALYALGIFRKSDEGETKVEEGIPHAIVAERCCGVNYLRGAFLGAGSLYIGKGYHLEFAVESKALAEDLRALLDRNGIAAKITDRKEKSVVYIKDSEGVSDCLALMGASDAVLGLNSEAATRQFRQYMNRQNNCDLANISKTVNAAVRQCEDIELIDRKIGLAGIGEKLEVVARARLSAREASFSALAESLGLSKSTLKNRLAKIGEIAAGIREKEKNNG
mgnify:FL=1